MYFTLRFYITQWEYSALMIAAMEGRTDVISLLLEAGANIDLQDEVTVIIMLWMKIVHTNIVSRIHICCLSHHTEWRICTNVGC